MKCLIIDVVSPAIAEELGKYMQVDTKMLPTQEELAGKKHDYELSPAGETVFCLDYKMSGVGSNSCGPLLLEDYQLCEGEFSFKFALVPSCN